MTDSAGPPGADALSVAVDAVPAAVVMVDASSGEVVHANPAAEHLTPDPLPRRLVDWVARAGLLPAGRDSPLLGVLERRPVHGEPVLAPDPTGAGRRRALWATAFPLPPVVGRGDLVLVALLPVDPGLGQAGALADVRARAMTAPGLSFAISDAQAPDRPLVWVSPEFTVLTGYSEEEALGRNCRFLHGPGTDPAAVGRVSAALAAGQPVRETLLNYRRDGTAFWNDVAISPVLDGSGRVTHLVGTQVDVTVRVEAEQARSTHVRSAHEARLSAEDSRRRMELMAQVADLLASSLDVDEALPRLTSLLVPVLADVAAVVLEPEDGAGARWAAGTEDAPALEPVLQGVQGSGSSRLLPDLAAESLGEGSAVVVPLLARHQVLGSLALVRTGGTPYDAEDLRLAEGLGRRVAVIVDNARLYSRQRSMASELQRALLPHLPAVEGLQMAAGYLPGADGAQVGGDWYDAVQADRQGAWLVVGDVSGHDIAAAAAMGQFRSVLRAYLWEGHEPGAAVARLDRFVALAETRQVASMVCGYLHPPARDGSRRLDWARAGHPPPLLRRASGEVQLLGEAHSPIVGLGLPVDPRPTATAVLRPGDLLVLYTDGLVEEPGRDLDEQIGSLARTLAATDGSAHDVCSQLLGARAEHSARDDLTALVVMVSPGAGESARTVEEETDGAEAALPVDQGAPGLARAVVARVVAQGGPGVDGGVAELLVSEVVSNAVKSGAALVRLRARVEHGGLRVEVLDDAPTWPPAGPRSMPPATEVGGRGLALLDTLADAWGVSPEPPGKVVWFVLRPHRGRRG